MAGAPIGNTNATKGKRWLNAIDTALSNRCKSDGQKALVALAEKMLSAAEEGEAWALKEVGDRLDGKPAQSVTLAGDEENPITLVAREIIHAHNKDS
jgi:hypothetical protein